MRLLLSIFFMVVFTVGWAQNDVFAKQYFDQGQFEKARLTYERLYKQNRGRIDYFLKMVECYQQLENYTEAQRVLQERIKSQPSQAQLYVALGDNHQRQGQDEQAQENYRIALSKIDENPNYAYLIGNTFQQYAQLEYALKAYKKGMELNPQQNLNFQIARLYGEMGEIENMYNSYLDMIGVNDNYRPNIQRSLNEFVTDDPNNENNILLRRLLLKKLQSDPNILWNEFLSWLFIQQKQYDRAFVQEKAIYKRGDGSLQRITDLAFLSKEEKENGIAREMFTYLLEVAQNPETHLAASRALLQIDVEESTVSDHKKIQASFDELFDTYGKSVQTIGLQMDYARFLAFNKGESEEAIKVLKAALSQNLSRFQQGGVKIVLGDILVYSEKFNQALIYYSQVQKMLKNHVVGQQARFKVAQTSYFKGDFDWAQTQLKVLRSSTTQLIANDAMELSLLISDNSLEDSTQTALKKYAKADLLAYQKKDAEAIVILADILKNHKGEAIEDEALLKQAKLFQKGKKYEQAEANYRHIIDFYKEDILADDAYFELAELYNGVLADPDKAKEYYEQIIFNHPDSIYFVEARKKYRKLRGDAIN